MSFVSQFLLPATLFALMFAMGLRLTANEFAALLPQWRKIALAFICLMTALPTVGVLLARLFALPPQLEIGLILVAASPIGTFSIVLAAFAGANIALSVALTAASSLTAILTLPILVNRALRSIPEHTAIIRLPVLPTTGRVLLMVGLPICIGILVRRQCGVRAEAWHHRIKNISAAGVVLIFLAIIFSQRSVVSAAISSVWMPIATFNLCALGLGLTLRRLLGLDPDSGMSISIAHTIRQEETGLFVALNVLALPMSALPLLINSIFGLVAGSALVWARRRATFLEKNRVPLP